MHELLEPPKLARKVGELRVAGIDNLQARAFTQLRVQRREGVGVDPQLFELFELGDLGRDFAQLVEADVEPIEFLHLKHFVRNRA